jgi:hypothetical protein
MILPYRHHQKFHFSSVFRSNWAGSMTQAVETLPSKLEALISHHCTVKRKKGRKGGREGESKDLFLIITDCTQRNNCCASDPTGPQPHIDCNLPCLIGTLHLCHLLKISCMDFVSSTLSSATSSALIFHLNIYIYLTTERYQEWITLTPIQSSSLSQMS